MTAAYAIGCAVSAVPIRDESAKQFLVEMLSLELWHLERMAFLAATCADRIPRSRWTIHVGAALERRFDAAMVRRWERANALARAAELTAAEADALWGAGAEGVRRIHAVAVGGWTERILIQEWIDYATTASDPTTPPPAAARSHSTGRACAPISPIPPEMTAAAPTALDRSCPPASPPPGTQAQSLPPRSGMARSVGPQPSSTEATSAPQEAEPEYPSDTGRGP
ncbi:hypothetical protein ACFXNW_18200 [Nocardia sp. NPDC059180]|uniref:hypothetical protein n=1 Tax=Nocardia sp. NPDC059180 TaxID=3346761 RepID=UPI0036856CFD